MIAANPLIAGADDPAHRTHSAAGRALRAIYDHLALAAIDWGPAGSARLLGLAGRLAQRRGWQRPDWRHVHAVFPALDPERARHVAARSAGLRLMNRAAVALVQRRGLTALGALLDPDFVERPERLAPPARHVFAAFHVGAHDGVGAALLRWQLPVLRLREMPLEGAETRARVLRQALLHMRDGGSVLAVLDGPGGASTRPVPCLGRAIVLRRGPFLLARAAGASIVPIAARWTAGGGIALGPPLDASEDEPALARRAAAWLEDYLSRQPEDVWPYTLANLLGAPLLAGEGSVSAGEERRVEKRPVASQTA
jgi:hypothetical protein